MWENTAMWLDHTIPCGGTWLAYIVVQTLPFFATVGLACETSDITRYHYFFNFAEFPECQKILRPVATSLCPHPQSLSCKWRGTSSTVRGLLVCSLAVCSLLTPAGTHHLSLLLSSHCYRIAENIWGRKLLRISEKWFSRRKLLRMASFCHVQDATSPNFAEKT